MKVLLAKTAGFCMGVRRAMQTVLGHARLSPGPIRTLGPLIHNPQVIEMLRGKGIQPLDPKKPMDGQGTVVIRAHGVTPEEKQRLCDCGFKVVDGTCPHVIHIQRLIAKHIAAGDNIIIIGDHGHAEVDGLMGYTQGRGHVVATAADVAALPEMERVSVVSQTTQSEAHYENLLALIRQRWPKCNTHRTICNSTDKRQTETIRIAKMSEAMVVVGGKNSANTVRLAELAAETGTPTFHIETSEELDMEKLRGIKTVGLTAGASTPNWMIVEVSERLKELSLQDAPAPIRIVTDTCKLLLNTHLYSALGAVGMGLGCAVLYPRQERWFFSPGVLTAAVLYIFAMHTLNIPSEHASERYSDPLRWRFHQRYGRLLFTMGSAALAGALLLSFRLGWWAFGLMTLAVGAGVLHRLTRVPKMLTPVFGKRRLAEIPGSKDLFMGLAWAAVLAVLPLFARANAGSIFDALAQPHALFLTPFAFFYVFTLVFIRSVVYDLREIQTDQLVGRETIPVVIGIKITKTLLASLTGLLLAAMLAGLWLGYFTAAGWYLLLPILYTCGYLYLFHRRAILHGIGFELVVGGNFLLVGALALICWKI